MTIQEIKVGQKIVNKNPYSGEGYYVVTEIEKDLVLCQKEGATRYQDSNGGSFGLNFSELDYYKPYKKA